MNRILIYLIITSFVLESAWADTSAILGTDNTLRPMSALLLEEQEPLVDIIYFSGKKRGIQSKLRAIKFPKDAKVLLRIIPETARRRNELEKLGFERIGYRPDFIETIESIFLNGQVESIKFTPIQNSGKGIINIKFKAKQSFDNLVSLSEIHLSVETKKLITEVPDVSEACSHLLNNEKSWTDTRYVTSLITYLQNGRIELIEQPYAIKEDMRELLVDCFGWPKERVLSEEAYAEACKDIVNKKLRLALAGRAATAIDQTATTGRYKKKRGISRAARMRAAKYLNSIESLGIAATFDDIYLILSDEIFEASHKGPFKLSLVSAAEYTEDPFCAASKEASILCGADISSAKDPNQLKDILRQPFDSVRKLRGDILNVDLKDKRVQLFRQNIPSSEGAGKTIPCYTLVLLGPQDKDIDPPRPLAFFEADPGSYVKKFYTEKDGFALDIFWTNFNLSKVLELVDMDSHKISVADYLKKYSKKPDERPTGYIYYDSEKQIAYPVTMDMVDKIIRETTPKIRVGEWNYQLLSHKSHKIIISDRDNRRFMTIRNPEIYDFFRYYLLQLIYGLVEFYYIAPPEAQATLRRRLVMDIQGRRGLTRFYRTGPKRSSYLIITKWLGRNTIGVTLVSKANLIIIPDNKESIKLLANTEPRLKDVCSVDGKIRVYSIGKEISALERKAVVLETVFAMQFQHAYLKQIFDGKNLPVRTLSSFDDVLASSNELIGPLSYKRPSDAHPADLRKVTAIDLSIQTAA